MRSPPAFHRAAIQAVLRWRPVMAASGSEHRRDVMVAAGVLALVVAVFVGFLSTRASGPQVLASAAMFTLLYLPVAGLSVTAWTASLAKLSQASAWPVACGWLALLVLAGLHSAASGVSPVRPLLGVAFTGLVTLALLASRQVAAQAMAHPWRLSLAILTLWMTSELDAVHGLALPPGTQGGLEAGRLLVFDLGLLAFLVVAPLPDVGYALRFKRADVIAAALALVGFAAVAVPLGLGIGFIQWSPEWPGAAEALGRALGIYFMVALPEELLFRGALQNLLERRWPIRSPRTGSLVVAAIVFGIAHLDNPPAPNVRYMVLATLAGIAYGWVWQRTRRISAAALTHAGVDWIWVTVFQD